MKETVECPICHKHYKRISTTHLNGHGITTAEFREKYPDSPLISEKLMVSFKTTLIEGRKHIFIPAREQYARLMRHCCRCGGDIPFEKRRGNVDYCSRRCFQEDEYEHHPHYCKNCDTKLSFESRRDDFCSPECEDGYVEPTPPDWAIPMLKQYPRRTSERTAECSVCFKTFKYRKKLFYFKINRWFCSPKCFKTRNKKPKN